MRTNSCHSREAFWKRPQTPEYLNVRLASLLLAAVTAACYHGSPTHPPPPPRPIAPADLPRLSFNAANSGVLPSANPIAVQVTVTITNTTARDTTLDVMGGNCEVLLRIYRRQNRTGTPVLDTSGPGVECFGPILHPKLGAGQSFTLRSPHDGPAVPLTPHRYWITAMVTFVTPTGSRRLELPAGTFVVPAE
jgi:hypothetical protein